MVLNPWLKFSLGFLAVWIAVWLYREDLRQEMLYVSLFTMLLAFAEPLFVPEYWSPPSLFNLAETIGLDIESFIFTFSAGGLAAVLYELIFPLEHEPFHPPGRITALVAAAVYLGLESWTDWNVIYTTSYAMMAGGLAEVIDRPDLWRKIFGGALLFSSLYFSFFLAFIHAYPGILQEVWNLSVLSGLFILGVPAEELLFAFSFGLIWSGIYEYTRGLRISGI